MRAHLGFLLIFLACLLAACSTDTPAQTARSYFEAIVNDDQETLANLVCAAQENEARASAASLRGTGASLENLSCESAGTDGDYQIVQCQGKIIVPYQGEQREFALGRYRIIHENNGWRWCGEAD